MTHFKVPFSLKACISRNPQYASGRRRGRSWRKRSRLRAHVPSTGRLTQKTFTKNSFWIHHGSGRGSLSLLAAVLIFRPLPQRPLSTWRDFPAPSVGAVMREVGPVWFVYSTTLLEPAKGETDDLGYVTKRLALIFYTLFPTHILLGGGARWEMENGWKKIGACWEIRVIPGAGSVGLCWGRQERTYPR